MSDKRRFLSLHDTVGAMGVKSWKSRASEDELERLEVLSGPAIIPFKTVLFVDLCKAYMLASKERLTLDKI